MFYQPLCSKLFPTIGFRIITELSSPEDLPDLEPDKESNELIEGRTIFPNSNSFLQLFGSAHFGVPAGNS